MLTLEQIVFYKEGSSQTGKVVELLTKGHDACIFADDVTDPDTLVGAWAMGADGIFNISANLIPSALAKLAAPWNHIDDVTRFRSLVSDVLPIIRYCYDGRAPINLKRAMNAAGLRAGGTRAPLNLHHDEVSSDILDRILQSQAMPKWAVQS